MATHISYLVHFINKKYQNKNGTTEKILPWDGLKPTISKSKIVCALHHSVKQSFVICCMKSIDFKAPLSSNKSIGVCYHLCQKPFRLFLNI